MNFDWDWGWDFNWAFATGHGIDALSMFMILLLNLGAVYRLSRLIARDTILGPTRERIQSRFHGMLVELMLCMWCLSFWFACLAVFLTAWDTTHDAWLVIATVLSLSTFAGQLAERA